MGGEPLKIPVDEPTEPATPYGKHAKAFADLDARIRALEKTTISIASSIPPPPPQPRPSLAVRAATKTTSWTGRAMAILGALVLLAQLLPVQHRERIGPLVALLQTLLAAFGAPTGAPALPPGPVP